MTELNVAVFWLKCRYRSCVPDGLAPPAVIWPRTAVVPKLVALLLLLRSRPPDSMLSRWVWAVNSNWRVAPPLGRRAPTVTLPLRVTSADWSTTAPVVKADWAVPAVYAGY